MLHFLHFCIKNRAGLGLVPGWLRVASLSKFSYETGLTWRQACSIVGHSPHINRPVCKKLHILCEFDFESYVAWHHIYKKTPLSKNYQQKRNLKILKTYIPFKLSKLSKKSVKFSKSCRSIAMFCYRIATYCTAILARAITLSTQNCLQKRK